MIRKWTGEKIAYTVDIILVLLALFGGGQLSLWMFDRDPPLTIHSRIITTPYVYAGDDFRYINNFTRHKFCEAHVQRWFEDSTGVIHHISPINTAMPTTGLDIFQSVPVSIPTPETLPPGRTYSAFRSSWKCNPFQKWFFPIVGEIEKIEFEIIERPTIDAATEEIPLPP